MEGALPGKCLLVESGFSGGDRHCKLPEFASLNEDTPGLKSVSALQRQIETFVHFIEMKQTRSRFPSVANNIPVNSPD